MGNATWFPGPIVPVLAMCRSLSCLGSTQSHGIHVHAKCCTHLGAKDPNTDVSFIVDGYWPAPLPKCNPKLFWCCLVPGPHGPLCSGPLTPKNNYQAAVTGSAQGTGLYPNNYQVRLQCQGTHWALACMCGFQAALYTSRRVVLATRSTSWSNLCCSQS